jgi:hypothetical protein
MAKINLVDEVLKHTDDEIIEYLYGMAADLHRQYNNVEDPMWLLASCGEVDQMYAVLRGLKQRNDGRKLENSL